MARAEAGTGPATREGAGGAGRRGEPPSRNRGPAGRWLILLAGSAFAAAGLEALGLPAGQLLGPLAVAVALAGTGRGVAVPPAAFRAGQAIVGVLIATSVTADLLGQVGHAPWLFAGAALATLGASIALGVLLGRTGLLPADVAIWGSMPGAATSVVLIAREKGADWRLVATMSYARVACVAALASVVAAVVSAHGGAPMPHRAWFPPLRPVPLGWTLGVAVLGAWGGARIGVPAAALNGPLALGAALNVAGVARFELPPWLLAPAYAAVGWRIGLAFTPDIVRVAARAAPKVLAGVAALIAFSAALALLLARAAGRDLLTAWLATSPGGADSVALIAHAAPVDVPFVMAMQVLRFLLVLVAGPAIARRLGARPR